MVFANKKTRVTSICIFAGISALIIYTYVIYIRDEKQIPYLFQVIKPSWPKRSSETSINPRLLNRRRLADVWWRIGSKEIGKEMSRHNGSETIHLCTVVIGELKVSHMVTCLKSLQYFNGAIRSSTSECPARNGVDACYAPLRLHRSPIHLHILTDNQTENSLKVALQNVIFREITVSFYLMDEHKHIVSWIPNRHASGIPALYRLLIPEVIAFDTDTLFNDDILYLWKEFDCFNSKQIIGAAWEQASYNFQDVGALVRRTPVHTKDGNCLPADDAMVPAGEVNGGLVLWHLEHMQNIDWNALWNKSTGKILDSEGSLGTSDQCVISGVISDNPHLYYELPCIWNVQVWQSNAHEYCSVVWPDRQAEVEYCADFKRSRIWSEIPGLVHFNTGGKPSVDEPRPIRNATLSRTYQYLSSM
ncbi:unnamed protein product [Calicophoron daubneyi]|uniref:Uncharacterized protein n=1 Tax=Calicophoron daubneyi TaxID=300641 RepID=A0AAV2TMP8_CALDB